MPPAAVPAVLLVVGLLQVTLLAGVVYGWAALRAILLAEGQYASLCANASRGASLVPGGGGALCNEQEMRLTSVYTSAAWATMAGRLAVGTFQDRFGPRITSSCCCAIEAAGFALLAVADSDAFDAFVPALLLVIPTL